MATPERRRSRLVLAGAAALALVAGIVLIVFGVMGRMPAAPPGSDAIPAATAAPRPAVTSTSSPSPHPSATPTTPLSLPHSVPTRIRIPAIGVDSSLMQLGLNADGTIQVPPFDKNAPAGWYRGSPTPGETGPSVILGHVDTFKAGPVVFYRLAQLRPGERISVARQDGTTAGFVVDRVIEAPKDHFPSLEVYGDTPRPELRLITCGGDWNPSRHDYTDNTVVFAHLDRVTR